MSSGHGEAYSKRVRSRDKDCVLVIVVLPDFDSVHWRADDGESALFEQ